MTSITYRLHGWNIASPVPLGHPAAVDEGVDVRISVDDLADAISPEHSLVGTLIAGIRGDRPFYELVRVDANLFVLRFHGLVDLNLDLSSQVIAVVARWHAGAERDLLSVMLSGTLMATLLTLMGRTVLHASAVQRDGRAVALVGNSGAGKSTLAAMCCNEGGRLVSDDVLDTWVVGSRAFAHRGGKFLRLREGSKALADGAAASDTSSIDGRLLWAAEPTSSDVVPIDAIVFPRLRPASAELRLEKLSRRAGLFALLGTPRVHGWDHAPTAARQLEGLVKLVECAPVSVLEIPWGTELSGADRQRITDQILG